MKKLTPSETKVLKQKEEIRLLKKALKDKDKLIGRIEKHAKRIVTAARKVEKKANEIISNWHKITE